MLLRNAKYLLVLLAFVGSVQSFAQTGAAIPPQPKKSSFVFAVGLTVPQSHDALRDFWLGGPSASLEFLIHTNRYFSLGAGVDYSILYFDQNGFATKWTGVSVKGKDNLTVFNLYMDAMLSLAPNSVVRPYIAAQVGAVFIKEAVYQEIVVGVRRTYYNVGGKTKLAMNIATGVTIQIDSSIALLAQIKGTFVHNDTAVGTLAHARLGVQYTL